MNEIPKLKACMCPSCGWIQACESLKQLVCQKCGKRSSFRVRGTWQVKIKPARDIPHLSALVKHWKYKRHQENLGEEGFQSGIKVFIKE